MNNSLSIVTNTTSSFQTNEEIFNKQSKKRKWQEYDQKPEVKAKKKKYNQRSEIKVRKKKYDQKRNQLIKEKERELQYDHVSSSKQIFDLSNFNSDDMYDEQVIKNALNNLELDQLNLLDKAIEQLLVSEKIAKQNVEWNNSIVVTSNLDSDIYDYNLSTGLTP